MYTIFNTLWCFSCRPVCVQDLQHLSDGLEGRSTNPVALLFDTLMQPNQDIGESHPPSLSWAHHQSKAISHVVLGRGKPGGSWHRMQSDVMSLSTGRWLQLPIYEYQHWEKEKRGRGGGEKGGSENTRVTLGNVAQYYEHYVEKMGIADNFMNDVTVTQVDWLGPGGQSTSCQSLFSTASECSSSSDYVLAPTTFSTQNLCSSPLSSLGGSSTSGSSQSDQVDVAEDDVSECNVADGAESLAYESNEETDKIESYVDSDLTESGATCDSDDTGISCCTKRICLFPCSNRWVVEGRVAGRDGETVSLCAKNVVLATGVSDQPKRLNVPGENLEFVQHGFSDINSTLRVGDNPLLIVGAGLSAADAVLHALSCNLKVVHVFYQHPLNQKLTYHNMHPEMYSDYVKLFHLMSGKSHHSRYTPLAEHRVTGFSREGVCTVCSREGETRDIVVSRAVVLIGGQAQLDFLPNHISQKLGVKPDQCIEAKKNPMSVDMYTFESESFPSLYAMGPLAGDNFVRFALGGAIGIAKSLHQKLQCED